MEELSISHKNMNTIFFFQTGGQFNNNTTGIQNGG